MYPSLQKHDIRFSPIVSGKIQVIEVAPTHCVVEISKSVGDLEPYKEFCQSLSSMLTEEESGVPSKTQAPKEVIISNKNIRQSKCLRSSENSFARASKGRHTTSNAKLHFALGALHLNPAVALPRTRQEALPPGPPRADRAARSPS
ncbi:hypothetical protein HYC85_007685 [Camellia sinensis]|uniref:Uncharacterized protein n=1 Tax=Camellia sinensis TaxID=4442 RepID=A0A7J7HQ98_CAMSI|nr:hypothetical protein HYC85_007685 [Camellia sinensis]